MSNKVERVWEEPVDDSTEESIAEEFRFRPHRLIRVKPGDRKIGLGIQSGEDELAQFLMGENLKEKIEEKAA